MRRIVTAMLFVWFSTIYLFSQEKLKTPFAEAEFHNCEINSFETDAVFSVANEKKQRVFVIFHAGKSETEIINSRRLAYVRDFLIYNKKWNTINVFYARGEKAPENGIVAFYVGGELVFSTKAAKNYTPCLDCCEGQYYLPQNLSKPIDFKTQKAKDRRRY